MAGTLKWIMGLSVYFVSVFLIVSLFSIAGMGSDVSSSTNYNQNSFYNGSTPTTNVEIQEEVGLFSLFSFGDYFRDIFSFFVFDIGVYDSSDDKELFSYFWVLRFFLVYLPLLALILAIWFSVPTVSQ